MKTPTIGTPFRDALPGYLTLALLVAALSGLFAAGVLSTGHLLNLPVPCGQSHACIAVAMHPASKVFGVPIAFFGFGAYLVILILLVQPKVGRSSRWGLFGLTGIGTLVSGWLLYISHTVIRVHCPWCIASGAAMAVLFALSTFMLRARRPIASPPRMVVWGLGLITAIAVGAQAGLMQRAALSPPIQSERLADVTADELVAAAKSVGPADAPLTIVMFADLWCPACRAVHSELVKYQTANSTGVRLAFRHLPLLELPGHQQSGAAAALAEIAAEHEKFWPFVDAIYLRNLPLDRKGYLDLLESLGIDSAIAETRIANVDDLAVQRVWDDLALAERLGVTGTPTFVVFLEDASPISASQRTLPRILNSPIVLDHLNSVRSSKSTTPSVD